MVYSHNPQSVINGFHSTTRNMFLTLSISIALYGFSGTFNTGMSIDIVKDLTLIILTISFCIGLNNVVSFNNYIEILKKDKENVPSFVDFNAWKRYVYINFFFLIILLILICAVLYRVLKRKMSIK